MPRKNINKKTRLQGAHLPPMAIMKLKGERCMSSKMFLTFFDIDVKRCAPNVFAGHTATLEI